MSNDTGMSDVKFPLLSKISLLADRWSNKEDLKNDQDSKDDVESDKDELKDDTNNMPAKDEDDMKPSDEDEMDT